MMAVGREYPTYIALALFLFGVSELGALTGGTGLVALGILCGGFLLLMLMLVLVLVLCSCSCSCS